MVISSNVFEALMIWAPTKTIFQSLELYVKEVKTYPHFYEKT